MIGYIHLTDDTFKKELPGKMEILENKHSSIYKATLDWITVSVSNDVATISLAKNNTGLPRYAVVGLTPYAGDSVARIYVTQH